MTEHPKHGSPGTANYIDARTTWFDQAVEGATKLGLIQVVVIAAGFDSRAYRLHAPGMQVYTAFTYVVRSKLPQVLTVPMHFLCILHYGNFHHESYGGTQHADASLV